MFLGRPHLLLLLQLLVPICIGITPSRAETPLPVPPEGFLLDPTQVLSAKQKEPLDLLLREHFQLSGQRLWVALLPSPEGESASEYSHRIFAAWIGPLIDREGKRAQTHSALLALFPKDGKVFLETGIGLESGLTDSRTDEILHGFVIPELGWHHPERAVGLGILEILKSIESPTLAGNRAVSLLREAGISEPFQPIPPPIPFPVEGLLLTLSLIAGTLFIVAMVHRVTAREAHFSAEGWVHPRAWEPMLHWLRNRRNPKSFEGGGIDGQW